MKFFNLKSHVSIIFVATLISFSPLLSLAQQQSSSHAVDLDHPQFLYHPQSLMTLGKGFDINHPEEERQICGEFTIHRAENDAALITSVEAHLVRNSRQLKRVLGLDVRMEGRFLIGRSDTHVNANYEVNSSDSSITLVLVARTEFGRLMASNYRLFPRYQQMIESAGGLPHFIASCGSHYVTTEFRAATAAVTITLNNLTNDEKESLQVSMNGGVNLRIVSASVKSRFEAMLQRRLETSDYSIAVHSIGGSGMSSLGGAISSLLTAQSPLQRMEVGMRDFLRAFTFDHAVPVRFVSSPFPMIQTRVANLSSEERDEGLLSIVDAYRAVRGDYDQIRNMVGRHANQEQRELLRVFPVRVVNGVRQEMSSIESYLHSLIGAQRACLDAPVDRVQHICVVPQEPVAPNFMFFRAALESWPYLNR